MTKEEQKSLVREYLHLEEPIEEKIIDDDEWLKGVFWGEPRPGHPEGMVLYHIREVLENVINYDIDPLSYKRLRLIALCHDSFKYLEETARPRQDWGRHHAVLAKQFLEKYTNDQAVLLVTELHDEAYHIWQEWHYFSRFNQRRWDCLMERIEGLLPLYYAFFKCDTLTGDKNLVPLDWFESLVGDKIKEN